MIRAATNAEAIETLKSDGVIERLLIEPKEIRNGTPYSVNERMLLVLMRHSDTIVEAHIAQAKHNWQHIHTDINEALRFIVNQLGYSEVWTNVRQELKTTQNLLIKHDFERVDQIDNEVILRWVLK